MVGDASNESFPNAPLIELVASARWTTTDPSPEESNSRDMRVGSTLLRALAREFASEGYFQSERIVPEDQEVSHSQPQYRFYSPDFEDDAVVYQAGEQVLTINAIPPYRTWTSFRPAIERGLRCLQRAFAEAPASRAFDNLSLNYIDAFGDEYTKGNRLAFLNETLGFSLNVPAAVSKRLIGDKPTGMFHHLSGSTDDGDLLIFKTGLATVGNSEQVVFDMTVRSPDVASLEPSEVIEKFDKIHDVIHETFMELSSPYLNVMRGTNA